MVHHTPGLCGLLAYVRLVYPLHRSTRMVTATNVPEKAVPLLSSALYSAYLIAMSTAIASVFRVDVANGAQLFFATSTDRNLIGHLDAIERLPKRLATSVRHVTFVASVYADGAK